MEFRVKKTATAPLGEDAAWRWQWELDKGGTVIARSAEAFTTEADARSSIAAVKKAAGAFRFAKTVTVR